MWHGNILTAVRGYCPLSRNGLESAFPVATNFDGLRVFEMTDLISFVRQNSTDDYTLIVARKNSLPESELPECIRVLIP